MYRAKQFTQKCDIPKSSSNICLPNTSEYTHLCLHYVRDASSMGLQSIVYLHILLKTGIQLYSQINLQYNYQK